MTVAIATPGAGDRLAALTTSGKTFARPIPRQANAMNVAAGCSTSSASASAPPPSAVPMRTIRVRPACAVRRSPVSRMSAIEPTKTA